MRIRCEKCGEVYAHFDGHECPPPDTRPKKKKARVSKRDDASRVKHWRRANPERYRNYMRDYMARKRGR